ncbi:hypothetical protein BJV78DRAFT_1290029 [Lactifluus subvellereus]|nr:hypothetical protein BJV78DRAFT_1290029 [Lactifluus subvellereus]
MSNFPTPPHPLPTIQQVTGVLQSVLSASEELLKDSPSTAEQLKPFFLSFYYHPTITKILGGLPQSQTQHPPPTSTQDSELASIKETLAALSKAVEKLCSSKAPLPTPRAAPQKKDKAALPIQTYADKAVAPPRPSLVLDLNCFPHIQQIRASPSIICDWLNERLTSSEHQQVRISATRLHPPHTSLPIRANVKWSKILINGVPTGVTEGRGAKTPEECHAALLLENPSYTTLQVTQKPSWVCPPSTYTIGSASSLVVAFEDLDGSKSRALLTSQQLYIFGVRAKVKRWKKTPPKPAQNPESAILNPPARGFTCSKKSSGWMSKDP